MELGHLRKEKYLIMSLLIFGNGLRHGDGIEKASYHMIEGG